jgi:ADP-ribose pyrophosphatase YjhB (NUDIX family)
MDRSYPNRPWVAVGVIVLREGKVLLAARARPGPAVGTAWWDGRLSARRMCAVMRRRRKPNDVEVGEVFWVADAIGRDPDGRVRYHNVNSDYLASAPDGEGLR